VNFFAQGVDMTNSEFRRIQDQVLQLKGRDLAEKLGVATSSISHWREERDVPEYIARLMTFLEAEKNGTIQIPLTIPEMIKLSRAAEARGITVEALLINVIRGIIKQPTSYTAAAAEAADKPLPKVAEPIIYKGPQSLAKPHKDPH
jgi:transcriptional regulator with XRE-family HTH domain